jgi:ribosomal protein S18 acetylase RimI-like enzyme
MHAAPTTLVEVLPRKKRTYWYTFEPSGHFVKPWWGRESSPSDLAHWLSVQQDGAEVARCKLVLYPGPELNSFLGDMPEGQLDILALEVAVPARGRGIGRETLRLIRAQYPLPRLTALNDDEHSRGFWDRVGWIRHESPHPLMRSERVTYTET